MNSKKVLIIYYSLNAIKPGTTRTLEHGNTKTIALLLKSHFPNCTELELKPKIPYPIEYEEMAKICTEQFEQKQKVEIAELESIPNIKEYDVIFIGFPIWFGTYPLLFNDFFSKITKSDWKDKKVCVFCTFGQSGIGNSIENLKKQFNEEINIVSKLEVINEQMGKASSITDEWVNSLKDLI